MRTGQVPFSDFKPANCHGRSLSHGSRVFIFSDCDSRLLKPDVHERKQLSKKSRETVSSAVSSRVRVNFGEAKIIKHDRYLSHDLARQRSHQNLRAQGRKQLSLRPRETFCSAVSSRVRRASQLHEETPPPGSKRFLGNIQYGVPEARFSPDVHCRRFYRQTF